MKPPRFEYHLPRTLRGALEDLKNLKNARLIAGGQSLMPMLNFRLTYPDHLIDLNGVDGLAYIREEDNEVFIGAMTTQRTIEFSKIIKRRLPLISEAILSVGHRQTRNRGTIGGSLCHLDPAAELPLVAAALEATVVVSSIEGERSVKLIEFAAGIMNPAIQSNEIVTEIRFTPWPQGHGWAFTEYSRRKGDFAVVAAAALVALGPGGRIERISLAVGGLGPVPLRITGAESVLLGQLPDPSLFLMATAHCSNITPLDDPFAPGWYRSMIAPGLARKVLETACNRAARRLA
jgi:aerobic carbon-monoxide dehydrogenase medium subunit